MLSKVIAVSLSQSPRMIQRVSSKRGRERKYYTYPMRPVLGIAGSMQEPWSAARIELSNASSSTPQSLTQQPVRRGPAGRPSLPGGRAPAGAPAARSACEPALGCTDAAARSGAMQGAGAAGQARVSPPKGQPRVFHCSASSGDGAAQAFGGGPALPARCGTG